MQKQDYLLKQHKLKVTNSRVAILKYLEDAVSPVDSLAIKKHLDKSTITTNRATVFRILNIFIREGIVKTVQFNEGKSRYELTSKPEHHHIVCTICGDIKDVNVCINKEMENTIVNDTGYRINRHMLEFTGTCPRCS